MKQNRILALADDESTELLRSVGLNSSEPLLMAVEAMLAQARTERPTHPAWHPLSARNAEGISVLRERLEEHGGWGRHMTKNRLEGVIHIESGRFLAVHNTCELTGLEKGLPRFASARSRTGTKQLREDLQGDFCELIEGFETDAIVGRPEDDLALHLCVHIAREPLETGEEKFLARAELIVGGVCSDFGIVGCDYRIPLDLSGMLESGAISSFPPQNDSGAVEAEVSIRRKP